jgi:hypothetical protein
MRRLQHATGFFQLPEEFLHELRERRAGQTVSPSTAV